MPAVVKFLGSNRWEVVVTTTSGGTTTETTIPCSGDGDVDNLPLRGRFVSRRFRKTSGSGATMQPILGEVTDPGTTLERLLGQTATAAASGFDQADPPVPYNALNGALYHREAFDAGADNAATTVYQFVGGWE